MHNVTLGLPIFRKIWHIFITLMENLTQITGVSMLFSTTCHANNRNKGYKINNDRPVLCKKNTVSRIM